MEKQHLKRLGYGFSALVMTLSAVTFYPSFNSSSAYAVDATSYNCGSADAVADGATVKVAWDATECVVAFEFTDEFIEWQPWNQTGTQAGATFSEGLVLSYSSDYVIETSGKVATLRITANGLAKMRAFNGAVGAVVKNVAATNSTIEHEETFNVAFDLEKYDETLSYSLNSVSGSIEKVGKTVLINSETTNLSFTANFEKEMRWGYEGGVAVVPSVGFGELTLSEGYPAPDYTLNINTDNRHEVTLSFTESGIAKLLAADNDTVVSITNSAEGVDNAMSVTVKKEVPVSDVTLAVANGSSTNLTIDDENSVATIETTVTPENTTDEYEIEYDYDEEKLVVTTGDNGTATVKAKTGIVLEDDTDVTVTANVKVDGEVVKASEPVTFKIVKNAVHAESISAKAVAITLDTKAETTINTTVNPADTNDVYTLSYTSDDDLVTVVADENDQKVASVTVGEETLTADKKVTITVTLKVGEETIDTDWIVLTINKNAEPEEDGGEDNNGGEDNTGENTGDNTGEGENGGDNTGDNTGEDNYGGDNTGEDDNKGDDGKKDDETKDDEAKLTGIKVSIDKTTIKASETAKISVTPEGKADAELEPTYTVVPGSYGVIVDENGVVSVMTGYTNSLDNVATIKVTAGGFTKEVEVTVKANFSWELDAYEVTKGDNQTYVAGSGEDLTFVFDAPFSKFDEYGVTVYNKTLMEKHESGEELTDAEIDAAWGYWLEPGTDYTVKEGSTIISLTSEFMAKLLDGEHVLTVSYYDDSDIDAVSRKYADATFTVTSAASPDTGVATAEGKSATASFAAAVATAFGAILMAGAAVFAKRK